MAKKKWKIIGVSKSKYYNGFTYYTLKSLTEPNKMIVVGKIVYDRLEENGVIDADTREER